MSIFAEEIIPLGWEIPRPAPSNGGLFLYFPPHHFSSNLSVMGNGTPIHMLRYEAKFKKAVLPDEIVLANGYHLSIPDKWRELRK